MRRMFHQTFNPALVEVECESYTAGSMLTLCVCEKGLGDIPESANPGLEYAVWKAPQHRHNPGTHQSRLTLNVAQQLTGREQVCVERC